MNKHLGVEILTGDAYRQAFETDEDTVECDGCQENFVPFRDTYRNHHRNGPFWVWVCDQCIARGWPWWSDGG
jgi:hypothetical protein